MKKVIFISVLLALAVQVNLNGQSDLSQLSKETAHYDSLVKALWKETDNDNADVQELMRKKVIELHKTALEKQIELSTLSPQKVYHQFYQNVNSIDSLIAEIEKGGLYLAQTEELISKSNIYLKRAEEMREEAYSLDTEEAKLGGMLNAEEQENLALEKQNELINSLMFMRLCFLNNCFCF